MSIKLNLSDEQIKSIAEDLEVGLTVYYHKETGETITLMNNEDSYFDEPDEWTDERREIEEHSESYYEFEPMDSRESFEMMKDFMYTVEDENLREKLESALNLAKPFRNFKYIIDNSGEYRNKWFDFKTKSYIQHVKYELGIFSNDEDRGE